jgi:hypothetical protein
MQRYFGVKLFELINAKSHNSLQWNMSTMVSLFEVFYVVFMNFRALNHVQCPKKLNVYLHERDSREPKAGLLHCALRVLHNLRRCGAWPGQPPPPPCAVPGHSDTSMSPLSVRCCSSVESFVEYLLSCSFTFTLVLATDRDYGRKNLCK